MSAHTKLKELVGKCVGGCADGVEINLEIGDDPPDEFDMSKKSTGQVDNYELRKTKGKYQSKPVIKKGIGYYYYDVVT